MTEAGGPVKARKAAKSEAEKKIKAGGDTQCEKLGVQAGWSIDTPHDGDEPMHFRLHCNICHQSLATKALPACDWEEVMIIRGVS